MRTRDMAFLGAASIGAFYGGLELLRGEPEPVPVAPVLAAAATGTAPAYGEEAPPPAYGWIPAPVPAPAAGVAEQADWGEEVVQGEQSGDSGVWSSPAEFAPSD